MENKLFMRIAVQPNSKMTIVGKSKGSSFISLQNYCIMIFNNEKSILRAMADSGPAKFRNDHSREKGSSPRAIST